MKKENTFKCLLKDELQTVYEVGEITDNELAKCSPKYFAKFLLTTNDGVDIYFGDKYYWIVSGINEVFSAETDNSWILCEKGVVRFSSDEAAQDYLDEQSKPKFEAGKVYHRKGGGFLFIDHFGEDDKDWAHGYGFDEYGTYSESWGFRISCMLQGEATPAEWEAALIKEAERRYAGKKFRCLQENHMTVDYSTKLDFDHIHWDGEEKYIYSNDQTLFQDGRWAEIVEPAKEQPTTTELSRYNGTHNKQSEEQVRRFFEDFWLENDMSEKDIWDFFKKYMVFENGKTNHSYYQEWCVSPKTSGFFVEWLDANNLIITPKP